MKKQEKSGFLEPRKEFSNVIEFCENSHKYRVNGNIYERSVTQSDLTFDWFFKNSIDEKILQLAIDRGNQLHLILESLIKNYPIRISNLPGTVSAATEKKIVLLKDFFLKKIKDLKWEPIFCELPLAFEKYQMVGTIDLILKHKKEKKIIIVDLKGSKVPPKDDFMIKYAPQMLKYEFLMRKNFFLDDFEIEKYILFVEKELIFKKI